MTLKKVILQKSREINYSVCLSSILNDLEAIVFQIKPSMRKQMTTSSMLSETSEMRYSSTLLKRIKLRLRLKRRCVKTGTITSSITKEGL